MKLANNSHTGSDTVDIDRPLGQEILGRHGDWLRATLDSRRFSVYRLVGHSVEYKSQNSCGLARISSTVLAQISVLAGDLTQRCFGAFNMKNAIAREHTISTTSV